MAHARLPESPPVKTKRLVRPGNFLSCYDYLNSFLNFHGYKLSDKSSLEEKLKEFQRRNKVPTTGRLNSQTCRLINSYRCVHPEKAIPFEEEQNRFQATDYLPLKLAQDRAYLVDTEYNIDTTLLLKGDHPYELINGRWSQRTLGFALVGSSPSYLGSHAWEAVRQSFKTWGKTGIIRFEERKDPARAEIRVLWTPGPNVDPNSTDPFYGPGEKIAVGYYPYQHLKELAGDLHLDISEDWVIHPSHKGFDVETVALHEIGHCLGIGHSTIHDSIMWSIYKANQRQLVQEDKQELERIYQAIPL